MTISTTASRIPYNGNGVTVAFSFPYRFLLNSDLVVVLRSSAGVEATLTLSVHYTVTGAGSDAGGTVTMVTPPAVGERLVIYRRTALTQETDYISGDPFPAETHERALDRLTMIDQEQQDDVGRTLRFPVSDTAFPELPTQAGRANRLLGFDADGSPIALTALPDAGYVISAFGESLIDDADATEARGTLGSTTVGDALFTATDAADARVTIGIPNSGPLSGLRNLVINGNFAINQRSAVSGAAVGATNTYTLDRWRVVTSGQSMSWSASGNGNLVTAPAGGIEQVVEGASIAGGTYVLNWVGTASATVNGSAVSKGGTATLTANTNATLRFSGGTVGEVQLEPGSVVTPFEARPFGLELLLCSRYYCRVSVFARGYPAGVGWIETPAYFTVDMRVPPTLTPDGSITSANVATENVSNVTTRSFKYAIQSTGSADCYVIGRVYAASAEL